MPAFIYKLGMAAQKNRRRLRGLERLAKVIAGVRFTAGVKVTLSRSR